MNITGKLINSVKDRLVNLFKRKKSEKEKQIQKLSIFERFSIFGENTIFYIGGNEALPPPLTPFEENKYINLLEDETKRDYAKSVLVEHNLRLVVYIAKRFENTKVGIEDLVSIGTVGLMKAINTFKGDKNIKLATYASRCIENEILMYIRKNSHFKNDISLEEPLNVDWDGNELLLSDVLGTEEDTVLHNIEREEEKKIIATAVSALEERDRQIIEMRFGIGTGREEKTQKQVADELGISQSYISRLEKKIIEKLKEKICRFYY